MKKNLKSFFKGFSLVELMISLITISLISAAFAPIITKKLSSMGVTVGSFGGNGGGGTTPTGCTSDIQCTTGYYLDSECVCQKCNIANCLQCNSNGKSCSQCASGYTNINGKCISQACDAEHNEDENGNKIAAGVASPGCCEAVGAVYVPASTTGTTGLCITKYNPGDDDYKVNGEIVKLEYAKLGIKLVEPNVNCTKSDKTCCWKGVTSSSSVQNIGDYLASKRTICQYEAANKICNNWAPEGSVVGSWRLLKDVEGANLVDNTKNNFVDFINELQLCSLSSETSTNYCPTSKICTGAIYYEHRDGSYEKGNCYPAQVWLNEGKSLLQVNKAKLAKASTTYQTQPYSVRCATPNILKSIKTPAEVELEATSDDEPKNQEDCPAGTLYINKLYINGDKNICITKYNMGDGGNDFNYVDLGIKVLEPNVNCTRDDNTCCWKGATSNGTTDASYSSYDAAKRMVCQYQAAYKLCNNFTLGNVTWRLLESTEADKLISYLNSDSNYSKYFSRYLDSTGLQLCSESKTDGMNYCPTAPSICAGATYYTHSDGTKDKGRCFPAYLWLNGGKNYLLAGNAAFSTGTSGSKNIPNSAPLSVRCVTDKKISNTPIQTDEEKCNTNEPCSQDDCTPYNALFINKKYIGALRNICMSKENFADLDAITKGKKAYIGNNDANEYSKIGIIMLNAGVKCTASGNSCCWQGNTSTGAINNTLYAYYPAENRTVCQYTAAYNLCNNWAPEKSQAGDWGLLGIEEANNLIYYLNADSTFSSYFSRYLDSTGLQLCSESKTDGMNYCPTASSVCTGATYYTHSDGTKDTGKCFPAYLWLDNGKNYLLSGNAVFSTGTSSSKNIPNSAPLSVRCVTNVIRK